MGGHTAAVKTGTTNDNRDAWTLSAINPDYVVGVWVGTPDNAAMANGGSWEWQAQCGDRRCNSCSQVRLDKKFSFLAASAA